MATKIVVQVVTAKANMPAGTPAQAGISVSVKDNSGANAVPVGAPAGQTAVLVNGKETVPWQAVFTGVEGPNEAQATLTALDTSGNPVGNPVVITETGPGGIVQVFDMPQPTSTIAVTAA